MTLNKEKQTKNRGEKVIRKKKKGNNKEQNIN